jgi:mono/diheme cytochrome c family protein
MSVAFLRRLWPCLLITATLYVPILGAQQSNESTALPDPLGIGRTASAADIARWNVDIMPDGTGLPTGTGTAAQGRPIYADRCAACHGDTGQKGREWLVGRQPDDAFPFGREPGQGKTIGSYWPYATTLFDYIRRAMPQDAPGSLSDDETYALTAHLLHLNEIIAADTELNARSLPKVRMPARDRFVPDDRRGGEQVR